ncbi:hypothetical protein [Candidatus Ichthyocystis hellenicum]|uniref:hypothetical protein n=1 Tax=Candidatus Ichthyocystis hellenicum TaxID=1561003 RepID=UPI000B87A266|nr:hypothetical protein [Candidatus Ichthyocystis hellenicum]
MSRVQERCQSFVDVGDSDLLMEECVFAEDICQDGGAITSYTNNKADGKSLVSTCNELSGVEGDEGISDDPSLDEVLESFVGGYFESVECGSILKVLVKGVLGKFTSSNICEDDYKKNNLSLSGLKVNFSNFRIERMSEGEAPILEDVIEVVLRVAVNVVVGLDAGCDFLLNASTMVKNYLVSNLRISSSELTRILLNGEIPGDVAGFSEEGLNVNKSELLLRLSRLGFSEEEAVSVASKLVVDLSDDVLFLARRLSATDTYYIGNKYFNDVSHRSSCEFRHITMLLRRVISLLVFFPEALHSDFVWFEGDEEFFKCWFTPEGLCRVKVDKSNAVTTDCGGIAADDKDGELFVIEKGDVGNYDLAELEDGWELLSLDDVG